MLMLSSYHLSDDRAAEYIQALERFDPVVIQAYPASIAFLAKQLEKHDRRYAGSRLRGIVTSSESLRDDQRRVIEERFKVRVFDWYGSFERVAAIGTCEQGNYHLLSDYGFVELVPGADGTAEIVGTGFDNFVMPLVRYRSVDSVLPADPAYVCPCRRQFPVIEKVLGRIDDQIKTSGRPAPRRARLGLLRSEDRGRRADRPGPYRPRDHPHRAVSWKRGAGGRRGAASCPRAPRQHLHRRCRAGQGDSPQQDGQVSGPRLQGLGEAAPPVLTADASSCSEAPPTPGAGWGPW